MEADSREHGRSLLRDLHQARDQGWRYFLTGDESWFFYVTDFERMWVPEGQRPQSWPRTIISTATVMVSIFSSPIGFPVITALPPKTSFSSVYFCDHIIPKIVAGLPFDLAQSPRKLMLHMDNANPHRAHASLECFEKYRIRPIDHSPSSPDLAPSDYYLFGKLEGAFAGREFASTKELLLAIKEVTGSIERDELESVFDAWERRLIQCIETQSEDVS
jgi:hypothetical protein